MRPRYQLGDYQALVSVGLPVAVDHAAKVGVLGLEEGIDYILRRVSDVGVGRHLSLN